MHHDATFPNNVHLPIYKELIQEMQLKLKNKGLYLIITIFIIISTSCSKDDEYNLDQFKVSLATVNPTEAEKSSYYLTLDNGSIVWPSVSSISYTTKANQRVIVNYTTLLDESTGDGN